MIVGIDASNLRRGGGITHLVEVLRAAQPQAHGFSQVIVWSGESTLGQIESQPWLIKRHERILDKSLPFRAAWQRFQLSKLARAARCDVLFVPGGSYSGTFHPVVTMSRNLLPFEWHELRRFGWSWLTLKLLMLRRTQEVTFRRADGLIFLTQYARETVMRAVHSSRRVTIIPHGIDTRFNQPPREQSSIDRYSEDRPYRVLYVSIIDTYKHQRRVAEAVAQLRARGLPVMLDLIGPAYAPELKRLRTTLARLDGAGRFIRYRGPVSHEALHEQYQQHDLFIFASSCENMPNILLEGMASGLPIACSNRGPMPEVLADAGIYFDPENSTDIARALRELIDSPALRARLADASSRRAQLYSWSRCARATFRFLTEVAVEARSLQAQGREGSLRRTRIRGP